MGYGPKKTESQVYYCLFSMKFKSYSGFLLYYGKIY